MIVFLCVFAQWRHNRLQRRGLELLALEHARGTGSGKAIELKEANSDDLELLAVAQSRAAAEASGWGGEKNVREAQVI